MGICNKNYKRKQNWNENEQKINTKRKCNIMQRDTPNTKAIFDLPAIKNTKSVLNTLVHIIFLRLFSLHIFPNFCIYLLTILPRCSEWVWESIICLFCVVVFQKKFLTHTQRDTPKSIFIFNSCQLLEKLDCFCAVISHYQSLPHQAF